MQLTAQRGLSAPREEALWRLGDELSLSRALALLEGIHPSEPRTRWRSRRTMIGAAVVVLALLTVARPIG